MSAHDYWVFGLMVRSEFELPELIPDESEAAPDVAITAGAVEGDWGPGLHSDQASLVLVVPEVARFRISDGKSIVVEALPDVPQRNVRLFLLGSAFGALLHQRGLLPLHANAIDFSGKALAFMGESGAGKSTLAAWMHDRGHRVIADDVCVVRFEQPNGVMVSPGIPRLRLWREALTLTGRRPEDYEPSYSGDPSFDKFDVPAVAAFARDSVELRSVVILDSGDEVRVERLGSVAAAEAVFSHTYRGQMIAQAGSTQVHWQSCVRLVREIPIYRWQRVRGLDQLDSQIRTLVDHLEQEMGA